MRIIVALGARPNVVRIAPVLPELTRADIDYDIALVSSRRMERDTERRGPVSFFGVVITEPTWFLSAPEGGSRIGGATVVFEELFSTQRPDAVMVVGDTNVTVAAAIAATEHGLPVVHLDAGMRCGDLCVPEEVHRQLVSRVAAMHLTPTEEAMENLEDEGVDPERIHFVGSTMAESVDRQADRIKRLDAASEFGLARRGYILVSVHKPENLWRAENLAAIMEGLARAGLPVLATDSADMCAALDEGGITAPPGLQFAEAVPYRNMLALERDAAVIVTDSSGVQVEACTIGTRCVTVAACTEQTATVQAGANELVSPDGAAVHEAIVRGMAKRGSWAIPKRWDRAVSDRVVRVLRRGVIPLR